MAKDDNQRDGNRSDWEDDGSAAVETKERTDRNREDRQRKEKDRKDGDKKFHVSKRTLTIGGICAGVVLIGVILYWLHARNFESTDDAYPTTHVHEISARVAGTVEQVNVDDNQLVKEGQTLVVLDQRNFKVAVEQARAQVLQRRAAAQQAISNPKC